MPTVDAAKAKAEQEVREPKHQDCKAVKVTTRVSVAQHKVCLLPNSKWEEVQRSMCKSNTRKRNASKAGDRGATQVGGTPAMAICNTSQAVKDLRTKAQRSRN